MKTPQKLKNNEKKKKKEKKKSKLIGKWNVTAKQRKKND